MRVGNLLKWWFLALSIFLVYAIVDASAFPEYTNITVDSFEFGWDPEEPFAWVHAGARLIGGLGVPYLVMLAVFGTGLIVVLCSLFTKDDE